MRVNYEVETIYYWLMGVVESFQAHTIHLESHGTGTGTFTFRVYGDTIRHSTLLRPRFANSVCERDVQDALQFIADRQGIKTDRVVRMVTRQIEKVVTPIHLEEDEAIERFGFQLICPINWGLSCETRK